MELKRKIRLFFVAYGRLLFEVIGVILLVILFLQWLDKKVEEKHKIEYNNQVNFEQEESTIDQKEKTNKEKEYISKFIEHCMSQEIQEAYSMLSEACKQEKYRDIDTFKNEYINKVFSVRICDYTISKKDDIYIIKLQEDLLTAGGTEIIKEFECSVIEEILSRKIYINS